MNETIFIRSKRGSLPMQAVREFVRNQTFYLKDKREQTCERWWLCSDAAHQNVVRQMIEAGETPYLPFADLYNIGIDLFTGGHDLDQEGLTTFLKIIETLDGVHFLDEDNNEISDIDDCLSQS